MSPGDSCTLGNKLLSSSMLKTEATANLKEAESVALLVAAVSVITN